MAERGSDEIRPVPVGWRHFREGFLLEPRPDAVGLFVRIGLLKRQNGADDLFGSFKIFLFSGADQRQRVINRFSSAVTDAPVRQTAVVADGMTDRRRHGNGFVESRFDGFQQFVHIHEQTPFF